MCTTILDINSNLGQLQKNEINANVKTKYFKNIFYFPSWPNVIHLFPTFYILFWNYAIKITLKWYYKNIFLLKVILKTWQLLGSHVLWFIKILLSWPRII